GLPPGTPLTAFSETRVMPRRQNSPFKTSGSWGHSVSERTAPNTASERHAKVSPAPSPLGGLGDHWSKNPREDEAAQNGNAAPPPRRNSPQAARQAGASVADLKKKIALFTSQLNDALERQAATTGELKATSRELSESLEREKATSQVLGIISSSPSDLQPLFE